MLHQLRDIRSRTWTLRFSPEVEEFRPGRLEPDATALNQMLESSLRQAPSSGFMMHRRFKRVHKARTRFTARVRHTIAA